jgi:hypothetical protein
MVLSSGHLISSTNDPASSSGLFLPGLPDLSHVIGEDGHPCGVSSMWERLAGGGWFDYVVERFDDTAAR